MVLLAGVASAIAVGSAAETTKVQQIAVTTWQTPGAAALDGIGSIVAAASVPTPAGGQATENRRSYAHEFNFVGNASAFGTISLDTDGNQRFATIAVNDGTKVVDSARYPSDWGAGKLYLPLATFVPGNVIAARTTSRPRSFTFVGTVRVPAGWGRFSPISETALVWYGTAQPHCASYPLTDHYRSAPIGLVAGDPAAKASERQLGRRSHRDDHE